MRLHRVLLAKVVQSGSFCECLEHIEKVQLHRRARYWALAHNKKFIK